MVEQDAVNIEVAGSSPAVGAKFRYIFWCYTNLCIIMDKYVEKKCVTHGASKFILEGRGYYRCTQCRVDAVSKRRKAIKAKLVQAFGGQCVKCGYNRCIENLTFHHIDPSKKEFGLAVSGITHSYKKIEREAAKCVLLCCRCHGEVHAGMLSFDDKLLLSK